jgi:hypothetical protein
VPPADLSRSGGNEPDLCEHPLSGDVLVASRRSERAQPILPSRNPAQVLQRGSRDTTTGDPLCNAKTDLRGPIHEVVEIEATHDLPIFIDEHVKNADPGLLFGQECTMSLSELLIEIVATIADRLGEVGPVRLLESEDRWFVISAKTLQFEHPSNLSWPEIPTTGIRFVHENEPGRGAVRVDFLFIARLTCESPELRSRSGRVVRAASAAPVDSWVLECQAACSAGSVCSSVTV